MTDNNQPVSPLRQRMIEGMRLRKLGPRTHSAYIRAVKKFTRFLIHTLPRGLHRIRHYDLLANARRASSPQRARALLEVAAPIEPDDNAGDENHTPHWLRCPTCGAVMRIVETFERTPRRGRDPP